MPDALDLDAYLDRIGWQGALSATHDTLTGLLRAHMKSIPFENLDVLLGRPVRLDLDSLQAKLVFGRRGGYCFEHGTLFAAVLERLGFALHRHTARVVLFAPVTNAPRTHMFVVVHLAHGDFVVDPGFGTLAPPLPVPLKVHDPIRLGDEAHWMTCEGKRWVLHTRKEDEAIDCWVSTLDEDYAVDFELGNHYTSTHPASAFVNRLMLRVLTPEGRITVMNRDVGITEAGRLRSERLADRAALRSLLASHFGFDLAEVETLRVPSIPEWD